MKTFFHSLALFVERRSWWIVAAILLFSALAVPGVLLLKTDSGMNSLVSANSPLKAATGLYQRQFGDEPITILLKGPLSDVLSGSNLQALGAIEQKLNQVQGVRAVYTPLALLNQAAAAVNQAVQNAQNPGGASPNADQQTLAQLMSVGSLSLDNPQFVAALVFRPDGSISSSFSSLVPDGQHAIISITPLGGQSDAAASQTLRDIEQVLRDNPLQNVDSALVSSGKLIDSISSSLKKELGLLLGLAVLVMLGILFLLFKVQWRLLSLLLVGVGVLWTFGLMGFISIPLSMATMAVLPILIGLGIDYPIQFHNRYQEELNRSSSAKAAVLATIARMAPAVGVAVLSTVIGFVTLFVSDVPMIKDFGTLLAAGVVLCYLVALLALSSILYVKDRKVGAGSPQKPSQRADGWVERALGKTSAFCVRKPAWIIAAAIVLAAAGGAVDHWVPVNTDYEKLIPQDLTALKDMREMRATIGASGQVHLLVQAEDVTDVALLARLKDYQDQQMAQNPPLISASGLVALITQANGGALPEQQAAVQAVLQALPPQITSEAVSSDLKSASLSFGVGALTLEEMNNLFTAMQREADRIPGAKISVAGSLALGASMVDTVVSSRFVMDILCLAAIFVVLVLVYRRLGRALLIIIPVGVVIGWASFFMFVLRIPFNPLTSILGVLTTAIGTEFMVLLNSRYEEERRAGQAPRQAMQTAAKKMGRAIFTTGVTTLGGFGVLIASNFVMVRDFGLITLIGILLCLISALTVMPALMVWADERKAGKNTGQEQARPAPREEQRTAPPEKVPAGQVS